MFRPASQRTSAAPSWVSRTLLGLIVSAAGLLGSSVSRDLTPQFHPVPVEGFTEVTQGHFAVLINQMGPIDSADNIALTNQCDYSTRILSIVEEGTWVEPGDIIMQLDTAAMRELALKREILLVQAESLLKDGEEDLRIQKLTNASNIAAAELKTKLAKLDLEGYLEAKYPQTLHKLEADAILAKEAWVAARLQLEFIEGMVKRGYRSLTDLENQRSKTDKAKQTFEVAEDKIRVLKEYTFERTKTQLEGLALEAERHVQRTNRVARTAIISREVKLRSRQQTYDIHKNYLDRLQRNIAACTIRAPRAGEVVLGTSSSDYSEVLKEGSSVRYLQTLAKIPDRERMEVNLRVHESRIRFLKIGQPAEIVVDAFSNQKFSGKITAISTVPLSGRYPNYDLKEYRVVVEIDWGSSGDHLHLAPGMSAQVAIRTNEVPNAISVPVTSVVELGGKHFAFIAQGDTVEKKEVTIGLVSDEKIEIKSGLTPGQRIVSQPRVTCADRLLWLDGARTL